MKNLGSITSRELFFGWWRERWVRGLVLMLIPIGVIDSAYTIAMVLQYGPEIEFNPITRAILAAGLWFPWALLNILGFTFFCMMAGSYYLYTRTRAEGPDTLALSFVIAIRVSMVGYNVTFYYLPYVGGMVFPPFWAFAITFVLTLYWMNKLLKRQYDISWAHTKYYFKSHYDNYKDAKLISSAGIEKEAPTNTHYLATSTKSIKDELPKREGPWWKSSWAIRVFYLTCGILSIVLMGFSIQLIGQLTGLTDWKNQHGSYFVLNDVTGPPVMASFLAIVFFMGISIAMIMRAFSTSDYPDV